MNSQAADEVFGRIEAASGARPGGVVATDGDGTLWGGDVGEDLFHAFLDAGRVERPAFDAFRRTAREHHLSDAGTGAEIARRMYEAYLGGRFPEESICELMAWCFAGWSAVDVRGFARTVVDAAGLTSRLHPELTRVLERVRGANIEIFLVSASPHAVVVEAGARSGFDEDHVVAARPRYAEGAMLADIERPIPYGPGKVRRLVERIGSARPIYAAFGDNAFDVAMLAAADVAVAVRPKPKLREIAGEVPGLVELAR